ncbi:DEAD/DEAH box helicase [Casimicrobium huifangae]|uniref:DEAD/DEAH box helicase n=1 Tax=Casimicrobium huifangae TaxID=2591109 RepID=UPI0012EB715F|nr:type ISP restriction/modification enzyme [Casimicrobium huifangae]
MSPLQDVLASYRHAAASEREKGTYFEDLIRTYLRNEASYRDLYSEVWTYGEWAKSHGLDARDTGIDLVARTQGTNELHAIQCKNYAPDYRIQKKDIDSFFTASGKQAFKHRIIVATTNHWSEHAEEALRDQQTPVSKIDLHDLENSQIDWSRYQPAAQPSLKAQKSLRPHQRTAHEAVLAGLAQADRGKLIMACGTGKTFTSLKIAETLAGRGGRVLFLVPSLALLSQALTEWTQESETPLHNFAVCSDSDVGKKKSKADSDDDRVQTLVHELRYPATTSASRLAEEIGKRHDSGHLSVVYGTYQSIDVVSEAQQTYGLADFDLIICDEAHRTTGATFDGEDESHFVKVHDADFIRAAKRLYMTATPRIYGDSAKATAERDNVALYSMDDVVQFGRELYVITFSEAVKRGLLVDYKVIVLSIEETHVSRRIQNLLKDENNQLKVDDAAKIIGCWKALSKQGLTDDVADDQQAMQRAVAFCQVIELQKGAKTHKVSSKNIANMFQAVVEAYQESRDPDDDEVAATLTCEAEHVDGGMNASEKEAKLDWLKAPTAADTCRILSNVRCLSEGVDVPALDAVLFLTPRNSQVDVVQSVGRVMRNAPGKKRGYIVLPVVIPAGVEPHEALNDNKTYKVVWQVLQALRSHDDRFDAMVNKLDLIGKDTSKMEIIAVTDKIAKKPTKATPEQKTRHAAKTGHSIGEPAPKPYVPEQTALQFEIGEIERAIYAKLVQKVGNRHHWEDWANDIAKIAQTHIARITAILEDPANTQEKQAFQQFAAELRDDLNDSVTDADIVEMLAQHLITKPVFDALFEKYSFASHNPMSKAMQGILDLLHAHRIDKEADTLQSFYDSVKMRAAGIDSAQGKQKIVVELYDKFFRNAFPKMAERLGIVYTPVEVVDFIIHSVNHILKTEFGETLGSRNVHYLDPFTGTGTFVTRLMQSGLLTVDELKHKYKHEIHANELVLLAYYIAAINIESTYHEIVGGDYVPFDGICLTDTFQMYEKEDLIDNLLVDNSTRRRRQKKLDIRVIVGNPPYSVGQGDANDNNENVEYVALDARIRDTYAARSDATLKNSLYDSYIRAIRWASDRIGKSGVIGFTTNAGFLEANAASGLRKCLAEDFSSIYVFHLRGNQRTSGERSRKEGGKIFGSGSRAPIAISLLVKSPDSDRRGEIFFHDVGDYLTREEKLNKVANYASVANIANWLSISPDKHGDWLNQRNDNFERLVALGDKKKGSELTIFANHSRGVMTSKDSWLFNFSRNKLTQNAQAMIDFYASEQERYQSVFTGSKLELPSPSDFFDRDPTRIAWDGELLLACAKGKSLMFDADKMQIALYRPFNKQWYYSEKNINLRLYQMPRLFPDATTDNVVIIINENWKETGNIALMANSSPDLHSNGDAQCFPLYLYETLPDASALDLIADQASVHPDRRDAITDAGLAHFQSAYPGEAISKEDLFYYVYGLLHSPDYRERYADNLSKELPRIPRVKSAVDFWAFSKAGRDLADLHLNYETVPMYADAKIDSGGKTLTDADYRVEKMKYGKRGKDKDLTTLIYNAKITVAGIPLAAYDYVVNGKPALDWVVERQCVKTDKDSGIVNDANDWAIETMNNPRYPLELFLRVTTVSLETMAIVRSLPALAILPN